MKFELEKFKFVSITRFVDGDELLFKVKQLPFSEVVEFGLENIIGVMLDWLWQGNGEIGFPSECFENMVICLGR